MVGFPVQAVWSVLEIKEELFLLVRKHCNGFKLQVSFHIGYFRDFGEKHSRPQDEAVAQLDLQRGIVRLDGNISIGRSWDNI